MNTYRAMVVGSTGAVGRHVVQQLVRSNRCQHITAVVRRPGSAHDLFGVSSDKIQVAVVDFDALNPDLFQGFDVAFSCLGTTRKQAGSAEAFKRVDLDYVVNTARLLAEAGTKQMFLVTAMNANANSWFLYPQTKGIAEQKVAELKFHRLVILRPGFLVREQTDRLVEKIGVMITPASVQVPAEQVARAMVKLADDSHLDKIQPGSVEFVEHSKIKGIAAGSSL